MKKTETFRIRTSPDLKNLIRDAATICMQDPSEWARGVLAKESARVVNEYWNETETENRDGEAVYESVEIVTA